MTASETSPNEQSIDAASLPLEQGLNRWRNRDVTLEREDRDYMRAQYGDGIARLFIWNDLDAFFARHDAAAKQARIGSQRFGVALTATGTIGLCVASFVPLLGSPGSLTVQVFAGLAVFVSGMGLLFGLWRAARDGSRRRWLRHRFATERARQLKYQFVLRHLPLAIDVLQGNEPYENYEKQRDRAFQRFEMRYLDAEASRLDLTIDDLLHEYVWIGDIPDGRLRAGDAKSDELAALLRVFRDNRIGVQADYVRLKLESNGRSPRDIGRLLNVAANGLTLGLMSVSTYAGYAILRYGLESSQARWAVAIGACTAAIIAASRIVDDGYGLRTEADRYRWYRRAVERIEAEYDNSQSAQQRFSLLLELERMAYEELRGFLVAQSRARFVLI